MSVFDKTLRTAQLSRIFMDLYRDHISDHPIFGQVLATSENFVCINAYDTMGHPEGVNIINKFDITRIRWGGNERTAVTKLIDASTLIPPKKIDYSSTYKVIKSLNKLHNVISFHLEEIEQEVCYVGTIDEMDTTHLLIHELGPIETLDRSKLIIALEDITRIQVASEYSRSLAKVHHIPSKLQIKAEKKTPE